jgi:hypothetical protein
MDIFDSSDVYPAQGTIPLGCSVFKDERGAIHRIEEGGMRVNILYTKAGLCRAGDLHQNTQFGNVFYGSVTIITFDGVVNLKREYWPGEAIMIPPGIPHLFYFPEDSLISEWWDSDFKAWYYRPYREIIEGKAPLESLLTKVTD